VVQDFGGFSFLQAYVRANTFNFLSFRLLPLVAVAVIPSEATHSQTINFFGTFANGRFVVTV
jgi:hypothetical protein